MNLIKLLKQKENLNNKQVAEIIGRSPTQVTLYLRKPNKIPEEIVTMLSERLGIEKAKPISRQTDFVLVSEAADRLGISEEGVMMCLQQKRFPEDIGICWLPRHGERWSYRIFRRPFEEYMARIKEN